MSLKKSPFFELRSGSVDTLLFTVKTTDLDALRTELVKRFEATPEFFADDVVAIDVRRLADGERVALADIRQMLNDVRMRPVGVVALATQGWAGKPACRCWRRAIAARRPRNRPTKRNRRPCQPSSPPPLRQPQRRPNSRRNPRRHSCRPAARRW